MDLLQAWQDTKSSMTRQHQGDCGVFSFWYATVLLHKINPQGHATVYPKQRTLESAPFGPADINESIRHYAKAAVKSGQGELLTVDEMRRVIERFGYQCESTSAPGAVIRQNFITRSLAQGRPVLFPYTKGDTGPVDAKKAMADPTTYGTPGSDFGSHWSLILAEGAGGYSYIDPHDPGTLETVSKQTLLTSNAEVDEQVYVRYWGKPLNESTHGALGAVGQHAVAPSTVGMKKLYDIGQVGITGKPRAQKLATVLISVY